MADTVRGVEYYCVTVPDAPGEVQRILSALKDNGVNLAAFHGFPLGGGRSQIDLVPDDLESLRKATEQVGVTLSEAKRAFLIQGDDRVGAVADTTAKLTEADINITAATATGAGSGRYGMILWVAPADYEKAAGALGAQYPDLPGSVPGSGALARKRGLGELVHARQNWGRSRARAVAMWRNCDT